MRAREVRGDLSFGEQILDIADDGTNDWIEAKNGGAPRVNKEVVLRSKLRIEARQFHMSRLNRETWGERHQIEVKNDWALLSQEERRRKADEIIQIIRELKEPSLQPPPLVYRPSKPQTTNHRLPEESVGNVDPPPGRRADGTHSRHDALRHFVPSLEAFHRIWCRDALFRS